MTGAVLLNTLPPRSSTKWLCVEISPKTIERGVRSLSEVSLPILVPFQSALHLGLPTEHLVVCEACPRDPEMSKSRMIERVGNGPKVASVGEHCEITRDLNPVANGISDDHRHAREARTTRLRAASDGIRNDVVFSR